MKPGIRTTEFYVTLATILAGAAVETIRALESSGISAPWFGITAAIAGVVYNNARKLLKLGELANETEALRIVAAESAGVNEASPQPVQPHPLTPLNR